MHRTNPARPVAAVLMLVWAVAVPAAGGLISDVGAIPNPFSPNADGVLDSTAIYYSLSEPATVTLAVADSLGAGYLALWSNLAEDEGAHKHWWDGWFIDSLATEVLVPDGEYRFLIKAVPESGSSYEEEEAEFPFVVDTEAPPLHDVEVVPSRFSPDGDGVGDSLMIRFEAGISEPSDQVSVTILDGDDEPVRQIYSSTGIASAVIFWDGADEEGAVASDGLFFVRVETRDAAGNQVESGALVDLDTLPPELGVDDLDSTTMEFRVDSSVAELTGWAHDRAGVVLVELSVDQEEWTEVALGRPDTVNWAGSVACESCAIDSLDETMQVFMRAHDGMPTADGQGHVHGSSSSVPVYTFDVIFDVAPPEHESSTVSGGDDTFEPGETITITTTWDDGGYTVTADFSQVDGVSDSLDVSPISGVRYSVAYDIPAEDLLVAAGGRRHGLHHRDRLLWEECHRRGGHGHCSPRHLQRSDRHCRRQEFLQASGRGVGRNHTGVARGDGDGQRIQHGRNACTHARESGHRDQMVRGQRRRRFRRQRCVLPQDPGWRE
jgi:hypothetical protein